MNHIIDIREEPARSGRNGPKGALLKEFQRSYSIHISDLTARTEYSKQVQGGFLRVLRPLVLRWHVNGAAGAHHSTHGTICTVILSFHWFEFKKLVSVEDAPSAPLRGVINILTCLWL